MSTPDYSKFREWLTLKGYSPTTLRTTVQTVAYFRGWTAKENIVSLEEVCYPDVMAFMQWCQKGSVSQKTIGNYLSHVSKYYTFLISEGTVTENPVASIKVKGIKRKIYYDMLDPVQLQELYDGYPTAITYEPGRVIPPQQRNTLSRQRNKVILGLLVLQGLRVEEVAALKLQDLRLREAKVTVHRMRRTASRVMTLQSQQLYELFDYVQGVRKQFLEVHGPTDRLFIQWRKGDHFYGITQGILQHLRKINPRVKNMEQLRASVITEWLRQYDLRKVQYLAGHKYVSSTEAYRAAVIDELKEDITRFHPF